MTPCNSFDSSAPAQVARVIVTFSVDGAVVGASVAAGASVTAGASVAAGAWVAAGACVAFGPHAAKSMVANISRPIILLILDIFSLLILFDRLNLPLTA